MRKPLMKRLLIKWLLNVEKMVNERWRSRIEERMKISRHQRDRKEAAYGFER